MREQLGLPTVQNDPGDVNPGDLDQGGQPTLQGIPGVSQGIPGGPGKTLMARGQDGQPVTVSGDADNPAAAMANAVWGASEAVAMSASALRDARLALGGTIGDVLGARALGGKIVDQRPLAGSGEPSQAALLSGRAVTGRTVEPFDGVACDNEDPQDEPLELAGTEEVTQEPWRVHGPSGDELRKSVPLGENDQLDFQAYPTHSAEMLEDEYGPQAEQIRQEHGLDYPHTFFFSRERKDPETGMTKRTCRVTGWGKNGLVMSHAVEALKTLIRDKRPMMTEFSAAEPSRMKLYGHLARRAVAEAARQAGTGSEYSVFHDPANPGYFHVVHNAVAAHPDFAGTFGHMEEIGGERVAMANECEEPLELAGTEEVEQEPWREGGYSHDVPRERNLQKSVPLGDGTVLNFKANPVDDSMLHWVYGSDVDKIRRSLGPSHNFDFSRDKEGEEPVVPNYGITGQGKAAKTMSHALKAVTELLQKRRPLILYFKAAEESRQRAYEHLARRAIAQPDSEYRAFRGSDDPDLFLIIHKSLAPRHAERFAADQEIEPSRNVAMSNAQDKIPAPAIDAPDELREGGPLSAGMQILMDLRSKRQVGPGYANMSPGQKILFEMRARRGGGTGYGFANEPPEPGSPPAPEAEYLGHGPTTEGQYGISFKTPEAEQQHLGVKGMKEIERGPAGHLMQVTFHNGSAATLRMPEEHRKEVFRQLLSRAPSRRTCKSAR